MSATVRAFVALRVPPTPQLRAVLAELAALGRSVKAVAAENLHLTVKFLGETDTGWLDDVARLLCQVAARHAAFDVSLRGLGAFPKPSRPSVIWTGMAPPEPVTQLATGVEQALAAYGFAPETRVFRPHVTLARIKSRPPAQLAAMLDRHSNSELAAFSIKEIMLMQSDLTPQGPRYTPLGVAELA